MNVKLDENNVLEIWPIFEEQMKEKNIELLNYKDFEEWCYEELYECPNCKNIVLKDEQTHMFEPTNADNVCDECIEVNGYYV